MGTRKPTKRKKYITKEGNSYNVTRMESITVGPKGRVTGGVTKDGAVLVLGQRKKKKKKKNPRRMGPPKP
jgi:hypothetical protein